MQRTKAFICSLIVGLTGSPPIFGQDSQPRPSPLPPSQTVTIGAQLVVWSDVQKPEPAQKQLARPANEPAVQQPPSRPQPVDRVVSTRPVVPSPGNAEKLPADPPGSRR
jgi:hypothetical protein